MVKLLDRITESYRIFGGKECGIMNLDMSYSTIQQFRQEVKDQIIESGAFIHGEESLEEALANIEKVTSPQFTVQLNHNDTIPDGDYVITNLHEE